MRVVFIDLPTGTTTIDEHKVSGKNGYPQLKVSIECEMPLRLKNGMTLKAGLQIVPFHFDRTTFDGHEEVALYKIGDASAYGGGWITTQGMNGWTITYQPGGVQWTGVQSISLSSTGVAQPKKTPYVPKGARKQPPQRDPYGKALSALQYAANQTADYQKQQQLMAQMQSYYDMQQRQMANQLRPAVISQNARRSW